MRFLLKSNNTARVFKVYGKGQKVTERDVLVLHMVLHVTPQWCYTFTFFGAIREVKTEKYLHNTQNDDVDTLKNYK